MVLDDEQVKVALVKVLFPLFIEVVGLMLVHV